MRWFIGRNGRAFWCITEPTIVDDEWTISVKWGKVGSQGQGRTWTFPDRHTAAWHKVERIRSKKSRNYIEVERDSSKLRGSAEKVAPCEHVNLSKDGDNSWACQSCGHSVEFGSPKKGVAPATQQKARRFIDLSFIGGE